MHSIELEDEIIVTSAETIIKLFSYDNGCDLVALYMFYHKQCKLQKTNQSFTVNDFAKKGLKWGEDRFKKAKRILRDELGLIEDVREIGEDGRIKGWFIRLKFIRKSTPPPPPTTGVVTPWDGSQETNAGSSIKTNAGSSNKEISTIVDKEQALVTEEKTEYGNKEINDMLHSLSLSVGCQEFKEAKKQQRFTCKHIVDLYFKIGKEEFMSRLKGILSEPFKRKNSNSLNYLYGELKSYIHVNEGVEVKTQKKVSSVIF